MDIFGRFSRSPDCLVAIDAADGGTWRSPFRPGVVYPATVPRNFATEPATWYAFDRAQKTIGGDDIEFEMEFYWNYDGAPAINVSVFATTAANNAIYMYAYATGGLNIMTNLIGTPYAILGLRAPGNPLSKGYHKIVARVIGNVFWAQLDSEPPMTSSYPRQTGQSFSPQISSFNGNIIVGRLKNLTKNTVLWTYPNFEEQTRLITKSNVWTGNGYFEGAYKVGSASGNNIWGLKTLVNLRYAKIDSTTFARVYFGSFTSGVAEQQFALYSSPFIVKIRQEATNVKTMSTTFLARRTDNGASVPITASFVAGDEYLNRWLLVCVRIDSVSGTLNLYVDGVLKATGSIPSYAQNTFFYTTADAFLVIGNTGDLGACRQDLAKIKNAQFIDRVLSLSEIQLLR